MFDSVYLSQGYRRVAQKILKQLTTVLQFLFLLVLIYQNLDQWRKSNLYHFGTQSHLGSNKGWYSGIHEAKRWCSGIHEAKRWCSGIHEAKRWYSGIHEAKLLFLFKKKN